MNPDTSSPNPPPAARKTRVRFAPSPTGHLHVGNARTALFNWLFARHCGGTLVLRIEDTDLARSHETHVQNILKDLRWLGLDWDEGPDIGGEVGPYQQSQRLGIYQQYLKKLIDRGLAYPCFCSLDELEKKRQDQLDEHQASKYDGTCRAIPREDWDRLSRERAPSWRFRMPEKTVVLHDLIRGQVVFDTSLFGDFIIMRPSGVPSFHFAVAVDDVCMKITHVVRGEDHLTNTPRHLALFEALGEEAPQFAHMSMVMGPGKTKLSKRHGAVSIAQYRERGYLPGGLANYIALLGWAPPSEIMTLEEMVPHFDLERVGKSASIFDPDKLDWVASQHVRREDPSRLASLSIPYLQQAGLISGEVAEDRFQWLIRIIGVLKDYVPCLSRIPDHARMFFAERLDYGALPEPARLLLQVPGVSGMLQAAAAVVEAQEAELAPEFVGLLAQRVKEQTGWGGKKFYMTFRVAVTGQEHGPELAEVVSILGAKTVAGRLRQALEYLTAAPGGDSPPAI